MKEELLHFVWKHKLMSSLLLTTTQNEPVEIIHVGHLNTTSGPDFLHAKIRFRNLIWAGSIEMHLASSDWYAHQHQNDSNYHNVILHVVWKHDKEIYCQGQPLPCVELSNYISEKRVENYQKLLHSSFDIPCAQYLVNDFHQQFIWMRDKLLLERLQYKISQLEASLPRNIFIELLFTSFGTLHNKESFRQYAKLIDIHLLQRWRNDKNKQVAYLLGQSNLFSHELNRSVLGAIYSRLKKERNLQEMHLDYWKTAAVRPQNQPKARILALQQILLDSSFISLSGETNPMLFKEKAINWLEELKKHKIISPFLANAIQINALIPFVFYIGKRYKEEIWMEMALEMLYTLPSENNKITRKYIALGVTFETAADSQAILALHHTYCLAKKCLFCNMGKSIVQA
jgi:hypothetical protein